jgi:hypothetical protein
VLNRLALGQVFLLALSFPPVSIIPTGLHSHLHLRAALTEGQTGDAWESSKINVVLEIREYWIEEYFDVIFDGLQWHCGHGCNIPGDMYVAECSAACGDTHKTCL